MLDVSAERCIETIDESLRRLNSAIAPRSRPLTVAAFAAVAMLAPFFSWADATGVVGFNR